MSEADPHGSTTMRLAEKRHVDALCSRFEAAWRTAGSGGARPRIEDYLGETPKAEGPALLAELIPLDAVYRALAGEDPRTQDYQIRFPWLDPAWLDRALHPEPAGHDQDSLTIHEDSSSAAAAARASTPPG